MEPMPPVKFVFVLYTPPSQPGLRQANRVHNDPKEITRVDRRRAYEVEVLSTFARLGKAAPELSDADRDHEVQAQRMFFTALDAFKSEVRSAAALTDLRKDALGELLATLHDATPDATAWDEAIVEARRSY
jgi:hypothetical protein